MRCGELWASCVPGRTHGAFSCCGDLCAFGGPGRTHRACLSCADLCAFWGPGRTHGAFFCLDKSCITFRTLTCGSSGIFLFRLMRTQRLKLSLTLHVRTWIIMDCSSSCVCGCVTLCVYGPPKNARHATKPLAQPLDPCSKKRAGQQARWARSALGTPMCELRLTCWRALQEARWSTTVKAPHVSWDFEEAREQGL